MIHDGHYLDFTMQFNIVFVAKNALKLVKRFSSRFEKIWQVFLLKSLLKTKTGYVIISTIRNRYGVFYFLNMSEVLWENLFRLSNADDDTIEEIVAKARNWTLSDTQ